MKRKLKLAALLVLPATLFAIACAIVFADTIQLVGL